MPLFEFQCRSCERQLEALVRPGSEKLTCADCGSTDLERLQSLFAVSSETTRGTALASGRKRAASQQRDAAMSEREHQINHHH